MAKLILAKNQIESKIPFVFSETGISVYTFEETTFHLYKYWKESFSDFSTYEFFIWIEDRLNLSGSSFFKSDKTSENYISLISMSGIFLEEEINYLKKLLNKWENTSEWSRLKENGDDAFLNGNYLKALNFYLKAYEMTENYKVPNNIGLCYKLIGDTKSACEFFEKADITEPNNKKVLVNLIEAYILDFRLSDALKLLRDKTSIIDEDTVVYLQGRILALEGNYKKSLEKFNLACKINFKKEYLFAFVDLCIDLRLFDEAERFVEQFDNEDKDIILKKAEVYYKANNIKKAIYLLENKTLYNNIEIYVALARYYRLSYNLEKSRKYINLARDIVDDDISVKLEQAYILKFEGKFKKYNEEISDILDCLKYKYLYE